MSNPVPKLLLLFALTLVVPATSIAQTVGPQRRVNPLGTSWRECSVAARLNVGNEAVVIAAPIAGGGNGYA